MKTYLETMRIEVAYRAVYDDVYEHWIIAKWMFTDGGRWFNGGNEWEEADHVVLPPETPEDEVLTYFFEEYGEEDTPIETPSHLADLPTHDLAAIMGVG